MFNGGTDGEWEKWGRDDPYFGVLTDGKFRMVNLTDANRAEFFRSGSEYIDGVLRTVRSHIDPAFRIRRALDFGCGVGRLVIPLSKVAEHVTGLDVSDSMLAEARRNCEAHGARGVQFLKSDDGLSALEGKFDFIHSSLVFQHIPVRRGERIFRNFLGHLERIDVLQVVPVNSGRNIHAVQGGRA